MKALKDGLKFHAHAIKAGFNPTIFTYNQLIRLYSKNGFIREAHNLFDEMPQRNVFTWNAIIWAYIQYQDLPQARSLFEITPSRDSVTYNSMLSGYINADGFEKNALNLFVEMHLSNNKGLIDEFTLTSMLNLTAKLGVLSYGVQLHSFMVKTGNHLSGFAVSSLIDMYSKCGSFENSCKVFYNEKKIDLVSKNAMIAACCREGKLEIARDLFSNNSGLIDTVSWNTLISGYVHNGYHEEAIAVFKSMEEEGFRFNEHSFASVLSACSSLKHLNLSKEIHAWVLKKGMSLNMFISSGIVDAYCKCENIEYAERVYTTINTINSFAITSLIVGYSLKGEMLKARTHFDSLFEKNHVVWTAMFSGYVKTGLCDHVFELFNEFKSKEASVVDGLILVSLLNACSIRASIDHGKQIHSYILRTGIEFDEKLTSALLDMYSKCGNISYSKNIFRKNTQKIDSVLYNVMIAAYAHHGYEREAIELFEEMIKMGMKPDKVTFVAILSTCRHCGLVKTGENYFSLMTNVYDIKPEIDHYACMIDLYGRANQIEKAVNFFEKIPFKFDSVIMGTLLNACKMNRNFEIAKKMEEKIMKIEGFSGARYTQLAGIYASGGRWEEMGRVMKRMRVKEVKKNVGCSWVHLEGKVHVFTSGGRSHGESEAIYCVLDLLIDEINQMGKI